MSTIHAWFSPAAALIHGSAVYRKESGSTVNVTRMSDENELAGFFRHTEKYVGRVVREEAGGCVGPISRVDGITSEIMRASDLMREKDEALAVNGIDGWEDDGGHTKPGD